MHILVIRTSAMGDVALTTPVIAGLRKQYPDIKITLLTRSFFEQFFYSFEGLNLFLAEFNKKHKGFTGIIRLFRNIKNKNKIDHVIDLHNVLRSRIICFLFKLSGVPATIIDKGRSEKKAVIKGRIKVQLKHSVERYCDAFARAGFPVSPSNVPCLKLSPGGLSEISGLQINMDDMNIGVAPYAKQKLKIWPEEYMIKLLKLISEKRSVKIWLFGGYDEIEQLKKFGSMVPNSFLVAGKLSLAGEIALISRLDIMITMDSGNMHMAAMVGTAVISIWGGTDPLIGFGAWQQSDEYALRIPVEELTCRPCTVFGKGECRRKDFACMTWLTPEKVFERLINLKII
ncbi:MAG: glycosyltransferase family 9 protein [Bacteroidia bacterium]|nr:glycosyltransferase family 9 protein [Bacteroidia bacterium]